MLFRSRKFIQTFFLAPQEKGYFVLNDYFHFVDQEQVQPAQGISQEAFETNMASTVQTGKIYCPKLVSKNLTFTPSKEKKSHLYVLVNLCCFILLKCYICAVLPVFMLVYVCPFLCYFLSLTSKISITSFLVVPEIMCTTWCKLLC